MLPKRIDRDVKSDNYRALALYVADARIGQNQGEKTLHSWYAGGEADDYLEGMIEVEAVQTMNTRTNLHKTYHLMVSFHPEDEAKLTPETLAEIEKTLAEALGFSEHQRHCGYHVNTANPHLHMSYNMINPRTFNRHSPYYDYQRLHRACRQIEQKYGLTVDPGLESDSSKRKEAAPPAKARTLESQTGQESLFTYVQRHKPALMTALETATTWADIQTVFLKCGLLLKLSGNGLAVKNRFGKHSVKASGLDRAFSKAKLEGRFGPFQDPTSDMFRAINADDRYSAAPLHQSADRNELYNLFQQEMTDRKHRLDEIRQENRTRFEALKDKWSRKREGIKRIPMFRHDRQRVMERLRQNERRDYDVLRKEISEKRTAVRTEFPYTSWAKCLQFKATQGNETALATLRSRNEPIEAEKPGTAAPPRPQAASHIETAKAYSEQRTKLLENHGLTTKHRRALLALVKMRKVLSSDLETRGNAENLKYSIDAKGTIIFSLSNGCIIRDTGKELYFNTRDEKVKKIAVAYAVAKWGQVTVSGLMIKAACSNQVHSPNAAQSTINDLKFTEENEIAVKRNKTALNR